MELSERAWRAALAVARAHGLPTRGARVVRDVTNVLVHLAPAPVVARVPVTLVRLRGLDWVEQHVRLADFLARAGAPVAALAADVAPGPHAYDGLHVTFWAYVDHDPARFDPVAAGRSLRVLHAALAGWCEPLPTCDRLGEVGRLLGSLRPSALVSAEELDQLRKLRARLAPLPGRPVHGDAHFGNVLWSPAGPLWTDLENACAGPVEWDLACLAWRGDPGTDEALVAYGAYDEARLRAVMPALSLFLAAWTVALVERVPTEGAIEEARRRIRRALAR
jgi:Phosphotransferase enzyme family